MKKEVYMFPRNASNQHSRLCNNPEEQLSHLYYRVSLILCKGVLLQRPKSLIELRVSPCVGTSNN